LVLLLCGFAGAAAAAPVTLGARLGTGIPNLRDNGGNVYSEGYSSRVAPNFGVYSVVPLSPKFSLLGELNYAAQGGKRYGQQPLNFDIPGMPPGIYYADFHSVAKLNYLELPVLATYRFGKTNSLFADLGPYVGYLLSASTETSGSSPIYADAGGTMPVTPPQDLSSDNDITSEVHRFNWGVQGGLGYERPMGHGTARVDLRAGLGLTNVQRDPANGQNSTGILVLSIGYGVPLGGRGGS
jgi:hypothetical protein